MTYNPDIHHRHSIRLRGYDYSSAGAYFVTICIQGRECLFGEVIDGVVVLNDAGRMVEVAWRALPGRFAQVTVDEFIVMPNHVHGIIIVDPVGAPLAAPGTLAPLAAPLTGLVDKQQGAASSAPTIIDKQQGAASSAPTIIGKYQGAATSAPTLGSIIRVFKSLSAIAVNRFLDRQGCPLWQRNYYERVIRDEGEFGAIREYIRNNPLKWEQDEVNPAKVST